MQVPGTQDIAGEKLIEVEAVKTSRLHPVVGRGRAHQHLDQKQQGNHHKELDGSSLAGAGHSRQHAGMDCRRGPLPAQVIEFSEGKEDRRRTGQQGDEAQGAPQIGRGRRGVACQGIEGEIVGIGIGAARPPGRRSPGGPGEKGRQLPQLLRVADIPGLQATIFLGMDKVIGPLADLPPIGGDFRLGEPQGAGLGVVAVLLQQLLHRGPDRVPLEGRQGRRGPAIEPAGLQVGGLQGQGVQVGGGEVRPQVGPVAPDGAVLHEPVPQKDLLPCPDVSAGKNGLSRGADHPFRNGRSLAVGPDRDPAEDGEADQDNDQDPQAPPGGEFETGLFLIRHQDVPIQRG